MVGKPADIDVEELEFDFRPGANVDHMARHGVTPEDLVNVLSNSPQFFESAGGPSRSGTHIMLGPDFDKRFFLVVLIATVREGVWRPITAHRFHKRYALMHYKEAEDE